MGDGSPWRGMLHRSRTSVPLLPTSSMSMPMCAPHAIISLKHLCECCNHFARGWSRFLPVKPSLSPGLCHRARMRPYSAASTHPGRRVTACEGSTVVSSKSVTALNGPDAQRRDAAAKVAATHSDDGTVIGNKRACAAAVAVAVAPRHDHCASVVGGSAAAAASPTPPEPPLLLLPPSAPTAFTPVAAAGRTRHRWASTTRGLRSSPMT